jgi:Flp pilus assembly pilin Flp
MTKFNAAGQGDSVTTFQLSPQGIKVKVYRTALLKFLLDTSGQDFVEYALMAAFVVASAATISPTMASGAIVMFSRVTSVITVAGS